MTNIADNLKIQENELIALKAMFEDDLKDLRNEDTWKIIRPVDFVIHLKPIASSCSQIYVHIDLHFKLCTTYPNDLPEIIKVKDSKNVSESKVKELEDTLWERANALKGDVMMLNLIMEAQEFLEKLNTPPQKSFYDDMLQRKAVETEEKEREFYELEEKIAQKKEEEKIKLLEELERRKEESKKRRLEAKQLEADNSELKSRLSACFSEKEFNMYEKFEQKSICFNSKKLTTKIEVLYGHLLYKDPCSTNFFGYRSDTVTPVIVNEWSFIWRDYSKRKQSLNNKDEDNITAKKLNQKLSNVEVEFNRIVKLQHSSLFQIFCMQTLQSPGKITVNILQEYCPGTSLEALHILNNTPASYDHVKFYCKKIVSGLEYLHSKSITHGDLTPWCIFVNNVGKIKIRDYALKNSVDRLYSEFQNEKIGSSFELSQSLPTIGKGKRADIYRLGVIILSVINGSLQKEYSTELPTNLHPLLKQFLYDCLFNNAITIHSLLQHSFIVKEDNNRNSSCNAVEETRVDDTEVLEENVVIPYAGSRLKQEFLILESLGKGGFGEVIKVKNKLDDRYYAIKCIRLPSKSAMLSKKIIREVRLLSRFNHENVVRYFNSWKEEVLEDDISSDSCSQTASPATVEIKKIEDSLMPSKLKISMENSLSTQNRMNQSYRTSGAGSWGQFSSVIPFEDVDEDDDDSDDFLTKLGHSFIWNEEKEDSIIFEGSNHGSDDENTSSTDNDNISNNVVELEPKRIVDYLYIQMEYCDKSTLKSCIDNNIYLDQVRMWRMFREILEGLGHIHDKGMIHRDLKPVNIFIDSNDHIKIGDFGLATQSLLSSGDLKPETDLTMNLTLNNDLTGKIGTVLYISPEVMENRGQYNNKVDMFSLGIIFFEMNYKPISTTMERHQILMDVRERNYPQDFLRISPENNDYSKNVSNKEVILNILNGLLAIIPKQRLSCQELLRGNLLPASPVVREKVDEMMRAAMEHPGGRLHRQILHKLFQHKIARIDNFTYDESTCRQTPIFGVLFQETIDKLTIIFRRYGAVYLKTPLLTPRSDIQKLIGCPELLDTNGKCVTLPYDLRTAFARYIAQHRICDIKRYYIGNVYRTVEDERSHPKELIEVSFDIVCLKTYSIWGNCQILLMLFDILSEFELCSTYKCTLIISHSDLLKGLLNYFNIVDNKHALFWKVYSENSKVTFEEINEKIGSALTEKEFQKFKEVVKCEGRNVKELNSKITELIVFNKKSNNLLTLSSQKLIKSCLKAIDQTLTILDVGKTYFKNLPDIKIAFLYSNSLMKFSGIVLQLIKINSKKKGNGIDTLAIGGRYDNLLESPLHRFDNIGAVGISLNFDKLRENLAFVKPNSDVLYDVLVSLLSNEADMNMNSIKHIYCLACELMKIDLKVNVAFDADSMYNDLLRKDKLSFVVLGLPSREGCVDFKVFYYNFSTEKIIEKTVSRDYVVKHILNLKKEREELVIDKSESVKTVVPINNTGSDFQLAHRTNSISGMADYSISYYIYLQDKLSTGVRRKLETQITSSMPKILKNIRPKAKCHLMVVDFDKACIMLIAGYLEYAGHENELYTSITLIAEKHQRHRKYIKEFCQEIYHLRNEKYGPPSVIVIACSKEEYYKVLM